MKTILVVIFFASLAFAQTKQDSVIIKEIIKDFETIQKVYASTDSLQYKRKIIMEFLQGKFNEEHKKLELIKKETKRRKK